MLRSILYTILMLPDVFGIGDADYLGRRRDYFSHKLKSEGDKHDIDTKLRRLGVLDAKGMEVYFPSSPTDECNVTFWDRKTMVDTGYMITTTDLMFPPIVTWPSEKDHFYTLYLGDLDDKMHVHEDHANFSSCLWLVGNIPGCEIKRGDQIFKYAPPRTQLGEELRRHLVLVFDQMHPERITFKGGFVNGINLGEEDVQRQGFRINEFAEWYHFRGPFAANAYLVCDDTDYV